MPPYDDVCRVGDSNSITNSNCQAAKDGEALLWHALCNDTDAAMDYIDSTAVIMNPLLHPAHSFEALSAESSPTLSEALAKLGQSRKRWTSYRMHKHDPKPAFGQPAMMAVQYMYKVTLVREVPRSHHHHQKGETAADGLDPGPDLQTVHAFCTSTWKQDASGGWKLCVQQLVPVSS